MPRIEVMGNRADEQNGIGRLGKAIVDFPHGIADLEVAAVSLPSDKADVIVYARKTAGTLAEAMEHSSDAHTPLMLLSSNITIAEKPYLFPLIAVPNAALNVINYLQDIETLARTDYAGWNADITEHHQEAKEDVSKTAKKLADMLGIGYDNIHSVRKFAVSQEQYNIPEESRDGYAIHSVVFTNPATGEKSDPIEIIVRGREVYAQGVIDIYHALQERPEAFTDGTHDIVQLVKSGVVRATNLAA